MSVAEQHRSRKSSLEHIDYFSRQPDEIVETITCNLNLASCRSAEKRIANNFYRFYRFSDSHFRKEARRVFKST
jgi:hypothetical protein